MSVRISCPNRGEREGGEREREMYIHIHSPGLILDLSSTGHLKTKP